MASEKTAVNFFEGDCSVADDFDLEFLSQEIGDGFEQCKLDLDKLDNKDQAGLIQHTVLQLLQNVNYLIHYSQNLKEGYQQIKQQTYSKDEKVLQLIQ